MNLKELSETLGLSQTTVSRALNGYPEVNEDTRRRVVQAAERYNYKPNTRAKSLATGRSMAIGHVIPISTKHEMVNPIFADFIAGAGETYSNSGYDMLLSVVNDEDEEKAYREMAMKGSVDGIIVHGPRENDPRIELLIEIRLPFVVHGRSSLADANYSWVDVNNQRSFQRATEFLVNLGHRRIALINGLEGMDFARRRRDGYLAALKTHSIAADPRLMCSAEMTEYYGHRETARMLAFESPPTAFLVSSLISGLGARRAIEEYGLKIGQDVSVIVHDDMLSYLTEPKDVPLFTATRSSVREAGQISAELLMDIIDNPVSEPRQILLEAELVVGQSTGMAPNS